MKRLMFKNFKKLKNLNTLITQVNAYTFFWPTMLTNSRKSYYLNCTVTGSSKRILLRGFSEKKFTFIIKSGFFPIKQYS